MSGSYDLAVLGAGSGGITAARACRSTTSCAPTSITSTRRATVVGGPQFSHYSGYQAVIAARNALFEACRMPMERVDRAVTKSDSSGFVQVVYRNDGTVVGVTVVAESAGEAIHEWILAVSNRLKMNDLASTIHVYRPYSIANQHPARRPARSSPF